MQHCNFNVQVKDMACKMACGQGDAALMPTMRIPSAVVVRDHPHLHLFFKPLINHATAPNKRAVPSEACIAQMHAYHSACCGTDGRGDGR